jgi:nitrogen fixation protein FixH
MGYVIKWAYISGEGKAFQGSDSYPDAALAWDAATHMTRDAIDYEITDFDGNPVSYMQLMKASIESGREENRRPPPGSLSCICWHEA